MARRRTRASEASYWPGFVDALTTLLLVIIFLLVVFVLSQVVLSQAISGKDAALEQLNRQVQELADLLDLERKANTELRLSVAQLSGSLSGTVAARDELEVLLAEMTARADALLQRAESAEGALADAETKIAADRGTIELRLRQIESLRRDIAALRALRDKMEAEVAGLAAALDTAKARAEQLGVDLEQSKAEVARLETTEQRLTSELAADRRKITELETSLRASRAQVGALRDRSRELQARLADERERTLLAQKEIEEGNVRLAELLTRHRAARDALEAARKLSKEKQSQIALLSEQLRALRADLKRLDAALDAAELKDTESQATIKDLGRRLNRALARKVAELARYRSEFFGRLKEVLGQRRDIEIVGDRFVFQSEVLFESASDELGPGGQQQMRRLAETLLEISAKIPPELNWVLRVDGHTDARPIHTPRFPSNWELSTARAISVVRFLIAEGVPATRLAATGFAEYQPIDSRRDEIGLRRNRRIELKLTQR